MIALRVAMSYTRYSELGIPPTLTEIMSFRQAQIAQLIADGHTDKAIAATLGISPVSIRTYVRRIAKKLELDGNLNPRIAITRVVVQCWAQYEDAA